MGATERLAPRQARMNETKQRASEDGDPLYAQLGLHRQGGQKG